MQRPIKFKAWDKNIEAMVDPENLHLDGGVLVAVYYENCDPEESLWETDPLVLENIVLLQYTGLKDKNGKEGFHKDLCQYLSVVYCIEWMATNAKFVLMQIQEGILKGNVMDMRYLGGMEIIGNIYENPELLEVKDE